MPHPLNSFPLDDLAGSEIYTGSLISNISMAPAAAGDYMHTVEEDIELVPVRGKASTRRLTGCK